MLPALDIDGRLRLDPPLVNGSGAVEVFGLDPDWQAPTSIVRHLGAYVTKSVTPEPRQPRPEPRVEVSAPGTLVNAVGLAGPGVEGVVAAWPEQAPILRGRPCIVSLAARTPPAFAALAARLDEADVGDAFELNLSCPNDSGGGLLAAAPQAVEAVVRAVRAVTVRALLVKLSPACGCTGEVARAAASAGADALVATNTMPVRAIDAGGRDFLGSPLGGMSGTALHAIALRIVEEAATSCELPVVGIGGIDSLAAAQRMVDAGARALGIGTAAMLDEGVVEQVSGWLLGAAADCAAPGHVVSVARPD